MRLSERGVLQGHDGGEWKCKVQVVTAGAAVPMTECVARQIALARDVSS